MWSSFLSGRSGSRSRPVANRRRDERFDTAEQMSCPLGELRDLSASGMRVACASKPPVQMGQSVALTIEANGVRVKVVAKVRRLRRVGLREFDLGMQFVNPSPKLQRALTNLAKYGFVGNVGGSSGSSGKTADRSKVAGRLPDPYHALGVDRGADADTIHRAYRDLALKHHPDVSDAPDAAERFGVIHEAYAILRDPEARATYDRLATSAA